MKYLLNKISELIFEDEADYDWKVFFLKKDQILKKGPNLKKLENIIVL